MELPSERYLAAMFTDRIFLQQITDIIQADYFESDANSWLLDVILDTFPMNINHLPTKDVLKVKVTGIENDVLKSRHIRTIKGSFSLHGIRVTLNLCKGRNTQVLQESRD